MTFSEVLEYYAANIDSKQWVLSKMITQTNFQYSILGLRSLEDFSLQKGTFYYIIYICKDCLISRYIIFFHLYQILRISSTFYLSSWWRILRIYWITFIIFSRKKYFETNIQENGTRGKIYGEKYVRKNVHLEEKP